MERPLQNHPLLLAVAFVVAARLLGGHVFVLHRTNLGHCQFRERPPSIGATFPHIAQKSLYRSGRKTIFSPHRRFCRRVPRSRRCRASPASKARLTSRSWGPPRSPAPIRKEKREPRCKPHPPARNHPSGKL